MPRTISFSLSGSRALSLSMASAVSSERASSTSSSKLEGSLRWSSKYEDGTPNAAAKVTTRPTEGSAIFLVLILDLLLSNFTGAHAGNLRIRVGLASLRVLDHLEEVLDPTRDAFPPRPAGGPPSSPKSSSNYNSGGKHMALAIAFIFSYPGLFILPLRRFVTFE